MNLSAITRSMGVDSVVTTDDVSELEQALQNKTRFVHFMIRAGNDKAGGDIPMKAVEIKDRFMQPRPNVSLGMATVKESAPLAVGEKYWQPII